MLPVQATLRSSSICIFLSDQPNSVHFTCSGLLEVVMYFPMQQYIENCMTHLSSTDVVVLNNDSGYEL